MHATQGLFSYFISVNELLKMKEDLTKDRDEQLSEVVKLREQLADSQSKQQKLETDQEEAMSKIQEVSFYFPLPRISRNFI